MLIERITLTSWAEIGALLGFRVPQQSPVAVVVRPGVAEQLHYGPFGQQLLQALGTGRSLALPASSMRATSGVLISSSLTRCDSPSEAVASIVSPPMNVSGDL